MLSIFENLEEIWGPLRLFNYITFRGIMAAATAFCLGVCIGPWLFRRLRALKMGQPLRSANEVDQLFELHKGKMGTATMGGLLIYFSVMISLLLWGRCNIYTGVALFVYTSLTVVGFIDDFLKVRHNNSKGLCARIKFSAQAVITLIAISLLVSNSTSSTFVRELWLPFLKEPFIYNMSFGVLFVFFFLVLAGSSNAINLTDGVDGLAIGCTISVTLVFAVMAYAAGHGLIADYLNLRHISGVGELAVICAAIVGAGMAFLWYNAHPAEIFMGDTGSLALGGVIGAIAFMIHQPFTLVIVGGVFVMEACSVIIQVVSYKIRNGKRVFLMAPIHHHFEIKGWVESKLVVRFWILSLIFAIAGLATLKLR
jgi:phospho-N-acetylmuramoyl-pentapeptide-transferase